MTYICKVRKTGFFLEKIFRLLPVFLVVVSLALGQPGVGLSLQCLDCPSDFQVEKVFKIKSSYPNEAALNRDLEKLLIHLRGEGFLAASIDSKTFKDGMFHCLLYRGETFRLERLVLDSLEKEFADIARGGRKRPDDQVLTSTQVTTPQLRLLRYLENHGFPFSRVWLDSISWQENRLSATLLMEKNSRITFDTIALLGEAKVHRSFLYNYLGFTPGQLYDESLVRKAGKRLNDLPFLFEKSPLTIDFVDNKARLNLHLDARRASRFNFLLGLLPNNEVTGRLLVTGEIDLFLTNPFGRGTTISLEGRRLQARTQQLKVNFVYPYLLNQPIGVDLRFELYKRDTLYIDLTRDFGVRYQFAGGSYFKAYVDNRTTIVTHVDTGLIKVTRRLPEQIDVSNTIYGVRAYFEDYDYRFNPRKGRVLEGGFGAGTRKVKINGSISGLADPEQPGGNFSFLYDSLELRALRYRVELGAGRFFPVFSRSAVYLSAKGAILLGKDVFENEVFRNEMFLLGGTRLLRGFDEESIFASGYLVTTGELRFLLTRNSNLYLFFDGAYLERRSGGVWEKDFPIGFGAGMNFETKAGIFSVAYAIGRQLGNPIEFRSAKVHLGYVNYF